LIETTSTLDEPECSLRGGKSWITLSDPTLQVAGLLLTTDVGVAELAEEKKNAGGGHGHGVMGGMGGMDMDI
jgi:hypothetical protein